MLIRLGMTSLLLLIGGSLLASAGTASAAVPSIVGGSSAISGWGFTAYVTNTELGFSCSGTVVAPRLVLTAGHCAADETTGVPYAPSGYTLWIGNPDWESGARTTVSRVIVDPAFSPITTEAGHLDDGDAALLELSSPTSAPAIPLANDPADESMYVGGTEALIAGWGLTSPGASDTPLVLQSGETVVQTSSYCSSEAPEPGGFFDNEDQMCVNDAPSFSDAICQGDSGGPLIAEDQNDEAVEIGLTSFGPSDCNTTLPQYFTRVDAIDSWVQGWITALAAPTASTSGASDLANSSASLNGSVTPGGVTANVSFQWGSTSSYGNTTSSVSVSGASAVNEHVTVSGLKPSTTYHFRIVATSANGTAYGSDGTFTTAKPRVETQTLSHAKSEARQTLQGAFKAVWMPNHVVRLDCSRASQVKFDCWVQWWKGAYDYWGDVYVWNELVRGQTQWTDHYSITRVHDRCYFHSGHRATCPKRKWTGSF
jgi:secreted trypsin-like serine protease